ncbi:hypothetical protein T265_05585 [Opisthorchis viverrini]|uniref:UspA domain-containing protein n=2 Tax=Opisthorchis viverrini TaxID=6198 RepID=A0A074ZJ29_OPIVI|nr:hypothetical protein T265_05585 [Opisthorchis viverrini]KER27338.1 hypothetical protein T265_05585 [Opisthorchis viverrini]
MSEEPRFSLSPSTDSVESCGNAKLADASRHILMPVDDSKHSERAFRWYLDHIMRPGDGLYLTHVVEPMSPGLDYAKASKSPAIKEEFNRHINELVQGGRVLRAKFIAECESRDLPAKFTLHVGSKPAEHIVRVAQEHGYDMIVMGNRGVGTIRRTFLGSVSDHIIHNAGLPVIIVPPPKVPKKK